MLILTRREDEAIQIGEDIRIVVVRTQSGQVKLGIEAPPDMQVAREELLGRPYKAAPRWPLRLAVRRSAYHWCESAV